MYNGSVVIYRLEIDIKAWAPRLAKSVLNSLSLKKGEAVTIEAWTRSLPWVDAMVVEARRIGALPMVIYESESAYWENLDQGRAKGLGTIGSQEWAALKASKAYVYFWGPSDRHRWHSLPEATIKQLTAYEEEWFRVTKELKLRWCRLELSRVTEDLAKEYGIDYSEWLLEILEASTVNTEIMSRHGRKISAMLEKGREILITHANGTKLELHLKGGRKPFLDDGVVDEEDVKSGYGEINVPSGEVVVAVDEDFAEGKFISNRSTSHGPALGKSEEGEWTFKDGRLVDFAYKRGEKNFRTLYKKAGPERDRPGIFSIGLNPKLHDAPLYEDQELGVVGVWIGANEWLGGSTEGDFRSWLLLRGADVRVDGDLLVKAGKIVSS